MPRLTRTPLALLGVMALTALTLVGCASDTAPPAEEPAATSGSSPGEASGTNDDPATPTDEPTGRLTLDGEIWDLTYDADDPNAGCTIVAGAMAIVSGMRTPDGNRVDLHALATMPSSAIATYFDDNENPSLAVSADVSSEEPKWRIEGTTFRMSGLWANLNDLSQPQVRGEVDVTC